MLCIFLNGFDFNVCIFCGVVVAFAFQMACIMRAYHKRLLHMFQWYLMWQKWQQNTEIFCMNNKWMKEKMQFNHIKNIACWFYSVQFIFFFFFIYFAFLLCGFYLSWFSLFFRNVEFEYLHLLVWCNCKCRYFISNFLSWIMHI